MIVVADIIFQGLGTKSDNYCINSFDIEIFWVSFFNASRPISILFIPQCQLTCRCQACPVIPESWSVMSKRLRGKQSGDWTRPSAHDRSRVVPTHEGARGEFRRRWIPVFERRYCMYMLFFPWEQGFRSTSTNEDLTRAKSLVNGKQRFGMNQVSNFAELILQSLPFFSEVCFARNVQIAEVDHAIWFVHVQEVFTCWKLLTLWRLVLIVIYVTIFAFYMHVEFSIWYGCSLFLLLCFSYLLISISHTVM